jgi:hypothetical protein
MRFRHSHLRLILTSFIRPVSHPRLPVPALLAKKSIPPLSNPLSSHFSTTTATMFGQVSSDPWNRLHDEMELFHNHFRHSFTQIYSRCDQVSAQSEDSDQLDDLLATAFGLFRHLEAHHSIEEYVHSLHLTVELIFSLF